jgi:hypothetical protein
MKYFWTLAVFILVLNGTIASAATPAASQDVKGKTCRMEQQCRWENFKKICIYVKVCR